MIKEIVNCTDLKLPALNALLNNQYVRNVFKTLNREINYSVYLSF